MHPELHFIDPDGGAISIANYRGQPLLLIFLRHLVWMACHGHLGEVNTLRDFLDQQGVRVLVVTFTPAKLVKLFLAENPVPFPIVSDPNRDGYRYFNLGRTSYFSFLNPVTLANYIRRFLQGAKVRKPVDQDLLQLGGDFLFDRHGEVVWSWPSQDATDRPTAKQIHDAVMELQQYS